MNGLLVIRWLAVAVLTVTAFSGLRLNAGEFLAGADLSHLRFFEDRGIVYREAGQAGDAPTLLRARGLNCVRLRLFTSSSAQAQADPYNFVNNLEYTVPLAVRVKQAGFKLLLNFHYSDTWADPGKQTKPAAWNELSFADLEREMVRYNSNCLAAFIAAGARPDFVQIGNEITGGMLWPDGRVGGAYDTPVQWSQLARLIRAATRGIRDAAGDSPPEIILHLDRGGDWPGTQWFFDRLRQESVEFDGIGQSYYPFWHGGLDALRLCLNQTALRYGKPVILMETAFPWTQSAPVVGLPATPEGQARYVAELARIVQNVPQGRGRGIVWWGAEYQQLNGVGTAGFEHRSFFDAAGEVLLAVDSLGQLTKPVTLQAAISGTNLLLSWPLSGAGWRLTSASQLNASEPWASTVVTPKLGTNVTASLEFPGEEPRFFRLESPENGVVPQSP
ncbi:MAG: glycosyl hydrolase 53 family protein [Verrucomicrobia bacterium]|nr:glycosyl hydrolase 53 family protein [Verrucomicrobiota bacterium]